MGGLNLALCLLFLQTVTSTDLKCDQDGLFGNPDNCLKFIICAHGQRQDFDCPQGMSWHAERGLCDATDLSKCTAAGASSGGSEDVFKQHLLSLLADFKPCHAGETTPASGTTASGGTSEKPGQGGTATTPGNPGNNGGSTTTERTYHPPSNTTDGGSSTENPGGNPTTPPNPGQGGNGSTSNPGTGDGGSTPMPTTVPPPTCPACPIPTEKSCPLADCPVCPTLTPKICPATQTCPPPASPPSCPACPTAAACPALPTCPPAPKCAICPAVTEKVCPTASPCPTISSKPICDNGWKYYAGTKSCYFVSKASAPVLNSEAQNLCKKQGAELPSIHSKDENDFIIDYTTKESGVTPDLTPIGLYRVGAGAKDFANYDGTSVDYTNWAVNQPDNNRGNEYCSEICMGTITAWCRNYPTGVWNDNVCNVRYSMYICKKPANV